MLLLLDGLVLEMVTLLTGVLAVAKLEGLLLVVVSSVELSMGRPFFI